MRKPRYFPGPTLVEVTCQTFQGRYLLTPTPEVTDLILGVIGRAQRRYGVRLHAVTFLSNHYHLLATVRDGLELARFVGYVNSNIAREVGRRIGWSDKFWSGRYQAVAVSDEEEAQVSRLTYLLAQGTKEGLVDRPADWPGVHAATALLGDGTLVGTWFDRTREYVLRRAKKGRASASVPSTEVVVLSPLPCWQELPKQAIEERARTIVLDLEAAAAHERARRQIPTKGIAAILRQHPHERPASRDRSPGPLIHAASQEVRAAFLAAFREFTCRFLEASARLRGGDRAARFPGGCFAPAVGWIAVEEVPA